jgi:hypothetical protein
MEPRRIHRQALHRLVVRGVLLESKLRYSGLVDREDDVNVLKPSARSEGQEE